MTREIIASILEGKRAEGKGGAYKVGEEREATYFGEEREATCFVATSGETLAVGRVTKVELKDHYVSLSTAKDERFAFAYEAVLGFKLAAPSQSKERSAGFGR
jgi:hypothetical protein